MKLEDYIKLHEKISKKKLIEQSEDEEFIDFPDLFDKPSSFKPGSSIKNPGATTYYSKSPPSSMNLDKDSKQKIKLTKRKKTGCFSKSGHNLNFQEASYLLYSYAQMNDLIDYPIIQFDKYDNFTGEDCTEEFIEVIKIVQRDLGIEDDGVIGSITIKSIEKKESESKNKKQKSISAPSVTSLPGDTISIKGLRAGRTHGSAKLGKNVIPGIINSVHINTEMVNSGFYTVSSHRYNYGWGNPVVSSNMIAAAKFAQKFAEEGQESKGIINLGNASGRYGGPIGPSTSHQVGLDIDCSYYRNDGKSSWWNAGSESSFKIFDVNRNVAFMYFLLTKAKPVVVHIFLTEETYNLLKDAVQNNNNEQIKNMFATLEENWQGGKGRLFNEPSHNNHYHIRFRHPSNSLTLKQLEKKVGTSKFEQLTSQAFQNSMIDIANQPVWGKNEKQKQKRRESKKRKAKLIYSDKKYEKYHNKDVIAYSNDPPELSNLALTYGVDYRSWKITINKLAKVIRVNSDQINNLTRKNVISLQSSLGISADGVVGGDTLTALAYIDRLQNDGIMLESNNSNLLKEQKQEGIKLDSFRFSAIFRQKIKNIMSIINKKFKYTPKQDQTANQQTSFNASNDQIGLMTDRLLSKLPKSFSFVVGTIDGNIIAKHNEQSKFYGASSQKTMAGLVQLIKYKNSEARLDDEELRGLLTYRNRWYWGKRRGNADSNDVNRSIQGAKATRVIVKKNGKPVLDANGKPKTRLKAPHYRKSGRPKIGVINQQDVKEVARIFDIKDGRWLYGLYRNRQNAIDYFKFFAGLARMDTGQFKDSREENYYKKNKDSFDKIIKIQKEGTERQYANGKGWLVNTGVYRSGLDQVWMKGGRASGALNIAFILEEKYVVTVHSMEVRRILNRKEYRGLSGPGKDTKVIAQVVKELIAKYIPQSLEENNKMKVNIILEKKDDNFKPHPMYDPKTGKMEMAKKKEDHDRLGKKGFIHLDDDIFDKLTDVLEKEGGASGMKPFEDKLKKNTKKEIETALKSMDNVGQHEKGDYILGDKKEISIAEMIQQEIIAVLDEKRKKRKKKKKKKKSSGKKDACYHKVKSRYKVWPSAYASGALVKCRKVGAKNWGNKSKKK